MRFNGQSRREFLKAGACALASSSDLLRTANAHGSEGHAAAVTPFTFHAPQSALDDLEVSSGTHSLSGSRDRARLVAGRAAGSALCTSSKQSAGLRRIMFNGLIWRSRLARITTRLSKLFAGLPTASPFKTSNISDLRTDRLELSSAILGASWAIHPRQH